MAKNSAFSIPIFVSGVALGALFVVFLLAASSSEVVNVVEFGERLCESKGLLYDTHEMIEDKKGNPNVPKIYCKKNELSVYDGVVVLGD